MSHDRARMRGEKRPGAWEAVNCHWVTTAVGFIHSQMNLLGDLINHFFFFSSLSLLPSTILPTESTAVQSI